jgi:hypothetical protein
VNFVAPSPAGQDPWPAFAAEVAISAGLMATVLMLQTEDGSDPRNCVRAGMKGSPPVLDYNERRLPRAAVEHRDFCWSLQRTLALAGLVSFTRRIGLIGTAHACGSLICGS